MKRIANITIWAAAGWLLMAGQAWALDMAGIYQNSATQQDHQVNGWACDKDDSEAAVQVRIKIWKDSDDGGYGACGMAGYPDCIKRIVWANVAHGGTGNACGGTTNNHGFRYTITAADKAFLGPGTHETTVETFPTYHHLAYSPKDITWDPRGAIDAPSGTTVTGWACDADDPNQGVYPTLYVGGHPDTCNPGVDCYEVSNIALDLTDTRGQACGGTASAYGWRWNPSQTELYDIGAVIGFGVHNVYALGFNLGTYGDDVVFGPQSITIHPPKPWETDGVITAAAAVNKSNASFFLLAVGNQVYRHWEDATAGDWQQVGVTNTGPWNGFPAVDGDKPREGAGITAMWFDGTDLYVINQDRYWRVKINGNSPAQWSLATGSGAYGLLNDTDGPLYGAPTNTHGGCTNNTKPWSGEGLNGAWLEPHDGKEYLTVVSNNCYWRKDLSNGSWTKRTRRTRSDANAWERLDVY